MSEFIRVGEEIWRLSGLIRAVWRGPKLVLVYADGHTTLDGEPADRVWRELVSRSERLQPVAVAAGS